MSDVDPTLSTEESDFELIRRTLESFDPETRHQVIEAMNVLRMMPLPAAMRILAKSRAPLRINVNTD